MWLLLSAHRRRRSCPSQWHGKRICAMAVCYSGDLDDVDEVLAPIRALRDPVVDLLGSSPIPRCSPISTRPSPRAALLLEDRVRSPR